QEWATEMGAKISDGFGRIINTVKSVVNWWNELSGTTQKVIGVLAGLTVAAGPVLLVVGKMITFVSGVVGALAPLMASITKAGGLLKWLAPLFGALTSPITLTIAGIAALATGFVIAYNKSESFRNFIDGLKDKFVSAWQSAMEFKDKVVTAFEGVIAIFKGDEASGINMLESLGLTDDQIGMITGAIDSIKEQLNVMKDAISQALSTVKDFFIKQFEGVKSWWDTDGALSISAMQSVVEKAVEGIKIAVDFALTFVKDLFKRFAPIVQGIWGVLWPTMEYLVKNTWSTIKFVIGTAMDLIQGIISSVAAIIEGDWS